MNFSSLYDQGFARVAAVSIPVHPAQPDLNADEVIQAARVASDRGAVVVTFPELCISGYDLGDLFLQPTLHDAVEQAIIKVVQGCSDLTPIVWIGAPLRHDGHLYNCAIAIHRGRIVGITPKHNLASYNEFYEKRYFSTPHNADDVPTYIDLPFISRAVGEDNTHSLFPSQTVPFGTLIIEARDIPGLTVSAEVCEDLWVPLPPSTYAAQEGARIIVNLSASPVTVGRAADRRRLVESNSARLRAAYVYCAAGTGESSTDLAWDGQTMIYENGVKLVEGERFNFDGATFAYADIDLELLTNIRRRYNSFADNTGITRSSRKDQYRVIAHEEVTLSPSREDLGFMREVDRFPFIPEATHETDIDYFEAYNIQVSALVKRLRSIGHPKIILGVSGGLDSTHALLVAVQAMDVLGRPRTDILTYTMPGFGTSAHTKSNAQKLSEALGVSFETIDITPSARQMLADMGHPFASGEPVYDITFENVQAGLRTDYLFRLANMHGGIVLGTGDLSELALGWCTYGVGDQMSHYGINAGVPKTMIQQLIRWVIDGKSFGEEASVILDSILNTEITPELIPPTPGHEIQSTQESVGPYNLQDFTLYYMLKHSARPSKIAFLAHQAWGDKDRGAWPPSFPEEAKVQYSLAEIFRWEHLFLRRFFSQQFKRSAMPNGPKVMSGGSLSPRGDWRMPSDIPSAVWIDELKSAATSLGIEL